MEKLRLRAAADLLKVTMADLRGLAKQGLVHAYKSPGGAIYYSRAELERIQARKGMTIAEEASQMESQIQRAMIDALGHTRKAILVLGGLVFGYLLLVALLAILFIVNPLRTAEWIGIVGESRGTLVLDNSVGQVLGEATGVSSERGNWLKTILAPIGKVSLGLVKNVSPPAYAEVARVAIIDPNDVLALDTSGAIIPARPLNLSQSSFLQVGSNELVTNLNSEYLQGLRPGTSPGDIAIVGQTPTSIVNLVNPSSSLNLVTEGPLVGGGKVELGETLTLSCPTCFIAGTSLFSASSIDTLTNKSISGLTNTITNVPISALASSDLTIVAGSGLSGGGIVALGGAVTLSLPDLGIAGIYGLANAIPVFTTDAQGRVLGVTSTAIAGLTVSNFSTASISQWSNDAGYLTTETDTLESVFGRGNTIPTTTGISANTIDEATLEVGDIDSSATQNFATLNITNGGSGFLDVELLRGFINFQGMNTLYDDFTSKSLDTADRWTSVSTGTGSSCTILSGGVGGLLRMDSGPGINRGCELSTQAIGALAGGYYQRGNNPIMETKLKIDVVTNARIVAGFTNTRVALAGETNPSTHHAYIAKRGADTTWQCVTDDGGATETTTNTGVTIVAGTFYRLRVELRSGTTPQTICTVDDGTTVSRTAVSATQPGSTSPMDVYIKLNQSDAVAKNMDVDYVRAWQDDPPIGEAGPLVLGLTGGGDLLTTPEATETSEQETAPEPQTQEEPDDPVDAPVSLNSIKEIVSAAIGDLREFFGNMIFHGDVSFLGHTKFGRDTAGRALIRAGESEVSVSFARAYNESPAVTANINLEGEGMPVTLPIYGIYDVSPAGFTIRLEQVAENELIFAWVALPVEGGNVSTNPANLPVAPAPSAEMPPESTPAADLIVL